MNFIIFFTLGLIILVMGFGFSLIKTEKERVPQYLLVLMGFMASMFLMFAKDDFIEVHSNVPTALDVYKGKTTLQITYRDSVPIDTVVVFKEKR